MKALTYIEHGKFALQEKAKPQLVSARDALVRVTLGSICTSDLHIKHGSVPRAVPRITVGHEMVGVVEAVGADVKTVKPGDRVTVNVKRSVVNVSSARRVLSTTAPILMAAGHLAAALTADKQNLCACPMLIRG